MYWFFVREMFNILPFQFTTPGHISPILEASYQCRSNLLGRVLFVRVQASFGGLACGGAAYSYPELVGTALGGFIPTQSSQCECAMSNS